MGLTDPHTGEPQSTQYGMLQRLDRETSGPIVVVKEEESFVRLKDMRDRHLWHKEYVCLVHGHLPPELSEGYLDNFIKTERKQYGGAYSTVHDEHVPEANPAKSIYKIAKHYKMRGRQFTLMHVRILTGKTHQVRVHMQYLFQQKFAEVTG